MILKNLEEDQGHHKLKEYLKVHIWKVKLFRIQNCETYEAILTQKDLEDYYESDIFKFFDDNP